MLKMLYYVFGFHLECKDFLNFFNGFFPNIIKLMMSNCCEEQKVFNKMNTCDFYCHYENKLTIKEMLDTYHRCVMEQQRINLENTVVDIDVNNAIRKTFGELLLI